MQFTDPAFLTAAGALAGVMLAESRQWLFGGRRSKADLAEIEQRIAEGLLSRLDKRLLEAEQRIAALEREIHDLRADRDALRQQLAIVTAERDALLTEREDLLNRISVLTPPNH